MRNIEYPLPQMHPATTITIKLKQLYLVQTNQKFHFSILKINSKPKMTIPFTIEITQRIFCLVEIAKNLFIQMKITTIEMQIL